MNEMERSRVIDCRFAGKRVVITGGTGSFGHRVAKMLLETGVEQIRIVSRDEAKRDGAPPLDYQIDAMSRRVVNYVRSAAHSDKQRAGLRQTDARI